MPAVVLANLRRTGSGLAAGSYIVTGSFTGYHPVALNQPVFGEFEGFGTMEATIVGSRQGYCLAPTAPRHARPCAGFSFTFSFG